MTEAQMAALGAMMGRVLPGGGVPGTVEAHAAGYVAWLLRQRPVHAAVLARGVELADSIAQALGHADFLACDEATQDRVIRCIQGTPHPSARQFFILLVRTSIAGLLGSPRWGGNRDGVGWRYLGYRPHPRTAGADLVRGDLHA